MASAHRTTIIPAEKNAETVLVRALRNEIDTRLDQHIEESDRTPYWVDEDNGREDFIDRSVDYYEFHNVVVLDIAREYDDMDVIEAVCEERPNLVDGVAVVGGETTVGHMSVRKYDVDSDGALEKVDSESLRMSPTSGVTPFRFKGRVTLGPML